jgi:transcriptional regulator with XRE-family HTH domain
MPQRASTRDAIPTLPARLRELRESAGMTLESLASAAGTSHDSISKIERGQRAPSFRLAVALADALGCAVDDLRRPVGERPKQFRKK